MQAMIIPLDAKSVFLLCAGIMMCNFTLTYVRNWMVVNSYRYLHSHLRNYTFLIELVPDFKISTFLYFLL